jgi:hypothetical protein
MAKYLTVPDDNVVTTDGMDRYLALDDLSRHPGNRDFVLGAVRRYLYLRRIKTHP